MSAHHSLRRHVQSQHHSSGSRGALLRHSYTHTHTHTHTLLSSRLHFPLGIANPPRISELPPDSQAWTYHLRYNSLGLALRNSWVYVQRTERKCFRPSVVIALLGSPGAAGSPPRESSCPTSPRGTVLVDILARLSLCTAFNSHPTAMI